MIKVLIVDDQPELRYMLRICLHAAGLEFLEAGDGNTALAMAKAHNPEIIILDVMMPDMNGFEVCSRIRATAGGAHAYIIILSSRSETVDRVSGLESGADAYLVKPFEPQEIMAQLRVGMRAVETRRGFLTDPLTGIFGRRAFEAMLEPAVVRGHRFNVPLCLMMIDIDNFKQINDAAGHAAGDSVIAEFAQLIVREARDSDLYFRWGGEEFAWLLTDTTLDGAAVAAERFRETVARHRFKDADQVTASIGIAMLDFSEDGASLCNRADAALYRAKRGGRNRVVCDEAPERRAITA